MRRHKDVCINQSINLYLSDSKYNIAIGEHSCGQDSEAEALITALEKKIELEIKIKIK